MQADHPFSPDEPLAPRIEVVAGGVVVPHYPPTKRGRVHAGGVNRPDGSFVENSLLFISEDRQVNRAHRAKAGADVPVRAGTWLFAGKHDPRFGHFLVESYGRLWALDHVAGPVDGVVFTTGGAIAPDRAERRFAASAPLLGLIADLPPCEIAFETTRFERLIVPPQGCGAGRMAPGCPEFRAFIRSRFARGIPPSGPSRLYISRTGMRGVPGHLLFEDVIEAAAQRNGYEIFHPQDHGLSEQIARYRAADVILGVEGSAFHMVAYAARNDARIGMIRRRMGGVAAAFHDQLARMTGANCFDVDALAENYFIPGAMPMANGVPDLGALFDSLVGLGFLRDDHGIVPATQDDVARAKAALQRSVKGGD